MEMRRNINRVADESASEMIERSSKTNEDISKMSANEWEDF